jgi:phage I-like protein
MSDFANIAPLLNLPADADEATLTAAITTLVAQSRNTIPEGHVSVMASRLADLESRQRVPADHSVIANSRLTELEQREGRVQELESQLGESEFEQAFSVALSQGRAVPAQKENFRKVYDADRQLGLDTLEALLPQVVTAARGDSGRVDTADAPDGVDVDRHALDRKVQRYMRDHNLDDYSEALGRVLEQEDHA